MVVLLIFAFLVRSVYTYCGFVKPTEEEGSYEFETKEYNPPNTILQEIAAKLKSEVK